MTTSSAPLLKFGHGILMNMTRSSRKLMADLPRLPWSLKLLRMAAFRCGIRLPGEWWISCGQPRPSTAFDLLAVHHVCLFASDSGGCADGYPWDRQLP